MAKRLKKRSRQSKDSGKSSREFYRKHMKPFPVGSKRTAFEVYCQQGGDLRKTREYLKKNPSLIPDERTPSLITLQWWEKKGDWRVMKNLVDDGILDVLEMSDDPDIQDILRDDAALMKFLVRLRSGLYSKISNDKSPLHPKSNKEALETVKTINDFLNPAAGRLRDAQGRRDAATADDDKPNNVIEITKKLEERGVAPTRDAIAREMIRMRGD